MEEILASIRRIIADDDASKAPKPPEPPRPAPPPVAAVPARPAAPPPPRAPAPPPVVNKQEDIDAMLADLDAPPKMAPQPAPPPAAAPAMPAAPDVLDLTEAMAQPAPAPTSSFRTIDGASDVVFTDRAPEPQPPRPPEPPRAPAQPVYDQSLISGATAAAVDSAFNSLAHTVLGNNARTLEDLVKEMLRPLLKAWLDDNLPGLVERIVRAEIERVSRGR